MAARFQSLLSTSIMLALSSCALAPKAKEAQHLKKGSALAAKNDLKRAVLEFKNAATAQPQDAEPHYQLALAYLSLRDYASAVKELRTATQLDPKHAGAQMKLAELMAASQDKKFVEEAVSRIQSVFGTSPDNPEATDVLALAEWKLGRPEAAFERLDEELKKFPARLQSSINLARMSLTAKDPKRAEEVLKRAVEAAPQSSQPALALGELYQLLSQPEKAEAEVRKAIRLDPNNGAALVALGSILIAQTRLDEAEATFKLVAALPEKGYEVVYPEFLLRVGKTEAALAELEKLSKQDANNSQVRALLVSAYLKANKISEAERLLSAALKRNPKDTDALLQRAQLYLKLGKAGEAEQDLNAALHFRPNSTDAHLGQAAVHKMQGLEARRREDILKALQLNPALVTARLELARSYRAARQARSAVQLLDSAPVQQKALLPLVIERNWALLVAGDLQGAKEGIDRVLARSKTPEVILQRSVLRVLQHDYAGARKDAEELLQKNPEDVRAASVVAETYALNGQLEKAVERLRGLAAAAPRSAPLQNLLGQWYIRAKNTVGARKAFEAAKSADAKFGLADLELAQLDLIDRQAGAARQRLGHVLTTDPKNITALFLLARADELDGNRRAAIERYQTMLNIDGSNLVALNNLAYWMAFDKPDDALKFAQRAADIAPDDPHVQDTLGWVYYRKQLYRLAVQSLKRAVEEDPTPKREFHLAMSYMKIGDNTEAQRTLHSALREDPNLTKTEKGW